jgi:carboxymethylenebutenolidase
MRRMPIETIEVPAGEGVADAYLARPEGAGTFPSVLFAMDAIGLRPRIAEMVEHIAAQGYVVLAPNLFYREGRAPVLPVPDLTDPDNRGEFMRAVMPLVGALDAERTAADGRAYLASLDGPVAVVGYCMGARFALRVAADAGDRVVAAAGFHGGGLVTQDDQSPHLRAGDVRAEVVFGHAKEDRSMTAEQIATLDAALDAARVTHTTEVYDGHHGYTMADTAAYDVAATERHWEALFGLLKRTL